MSLFSTLQKRVHEEGRLAALAGAPFSSRPYASPHLARAWREGYEQGEVEQAEGGHFREAKR